MAGQVLNQDSLTHTLAGLQEDLNLGLPSANPTFSPPREGDKEEAGPGFQYAEDSQTKKNNQRG